MSDVTRILSQIDAGDPSAEKRQQTPGTRESSEGSGSANLSLGAVSRPSAIKLRKG